MHRKMDMGLTLDQSPVSVFCHSVIFGYLLFFLIIFNEPSQFLFGY